MTILRYSGNGVPQKVFGRNTGVLRQDGCDREAGSGAGDGGDNRDAEFLGEAGKPVSILNEYNITITEAERYG